MSWKASVGFVLGPQCFLSVLMADLVSARILSFSFSYLRADNVFCLDLGCQGGGL